LRDVAFGLTMTGMGMGVTITTLAILILVIRLLIRFFPFKEKGDEK